MNASDRELDPQAQQLLASARARRITNEIQAVERLAANSAGRVRLDGVVAAGARIFAFDVRYDVRTVVSATPGVAPQEMDVPTRTTVLARFTLENYPDAAPTIGLLSNEPLFLPAVTGPPLPVVDGRFPAWVCTHRHFDPREHDLVFFVSQVLRALVVDPAVLNSADDALNPIAARWMLARRRRLSLPFEADLLPTVPRSDAGVERAPAFTLKRVAR